MINEPFIRFVFLCCEKMFDRQKFLMYNMFVIKRKEVQIMKNEIILFENQNVKLEVNMKDETVWLNREQLAKLYDRDIKTIGKHINC